MLEIPGLVAGLRPIGKILKVSHEQVRTLHRKGLIPVVKLGSEYVGDRDALAECVKQGRYRDAMQKKTTRVDAREDEREVA
jgi:hypothetical protein